MSTYGDMIASAEGDYNTAMGQIPETGELSNQQLFDMQKAMMNYQLKITAITNMMKSESDAHQAIAANMK